MDAGAAIPVILTVEANQLDADLNTIDWLARLALEARRRGGRIAVRGASVELDGLIELVGLGELLRPPPPRPPPRPGPRSAHPPR
jgi:hypothetical protein